MTREENEASQELGWEKAKIRIAKFLQEQAHTARAFTTSEVLGMAIAICELPFPKSEIEPPRLVWPEPHSR